MHNNSEIFDIHNRASQRELRLVIEIGYDLPLYITSHTDIPGLPVNAILGVLKKCSATSQRLLPEQGRAEIGAINFEVVDVAGQLSYALRDELEQGNGIKGRTVRLYQGFAGLDWSDFRLEQTQTAEDSLSYAEGVYKVRCRDIQRELRTDIFTLNATRLAADFSKSDDTLQVYDASSFEPNPHTSAYGDAPNQSVYYLKIKYQDGFEIVRATGKTDTSFTECSRGCFGTYARDHTLPEDSDEENGVEVEEFVYLEGPGPQLAYALLTGVILGTDDVLPSNWHLGIAPNYAVLDEFENIGSDWYKPGDHTKGKILRFDGLEKTDGKKFIETEINLLLGAYMPVNAEGQLGFRRMAGVLAEAGTVATIGPDDVAKLGELKYNLAGVRNAFSIQWSWFEQPGFDGKFLRSNNLVDADSIAVHGEAKSHTLKFRGLHNSRHTYTTIKNTFDALRDRSAGPPLSLRLGLLPSNNDLEVGDIVRVSLPQVREHSINGGRAYDFSFSSGDEGWGVPSGSVTADTDRGTFNVTVSDENPWISRTFSPTFSGDDLPFIKIRVRRTSDEPIAPGTGSKLFFRLSGGSGYLSAGADEMLDFIDRLNAAQNEWQELVLDLSGNSDWTEGQIELVRFDIGHDHSADYSYEVDYIRFLPTLGLDEYSLDRAMEIQRISVDQVSGSVTVDLFSSYQPAGMIADQLESTNAELPDEWYEAEGTAMTDAGLSIDGSGFLIADGTLTGNPDSREIFYHLGDLTIPAGQTLSVSDNVELRVRGVLQIEGTLQGIPSNYGVGFLGSCRGGSGILSGQSQHSNRIAEAARGEVVTGRNAVMPQLSIENAGGELLGIPDDLRGSGGARGGNSFFYLRNDASYELSGFGGSGGGGGAGVSVIARGIAIGVSGVIENSGGDGAPGSGTQTQPGEPGGSGGGGAPGGILLLVDGTQNPMPVLTNSKIIACYGVSPDSPGRAGEGGACLGTNAVRLMFVPKSRLPYPDHQDPALDPDIQAALDAAAEAQAYADQALGELQNIGADGKLHANEKFRVVREYLQITQEQAGIESQATALGITTEKTNYSDLIDTLTSYLEGLDPAWDDAAASTSISRTIWDINWQNVYQARQALLDKFVAVLRQRVETADDAAANAQKAAEEAQADAVIALQETLDISADGKLHPSEKVGEIRKYNELIAEQADIEAQADRFSITTEKNNYIANLNLLTSYLEDLDPPWDDLENTTPIARGTWNTRWTAVGSAKSALLRAVADQAIVVAEATGDKIAKLASGDNLVQGDFSDDELYWSKGEVFTNTADYSYLPEGMKVLKVSDRGSYARYWFPVKEGDRFYISADIYTGSSTGGNVNIGLHYSDISEFGTGIAISTNRVWLKGGFISRTPNQGYGFVEALIIVPAGWAMAKGYIQINADEGQTGSAFVHNLKIRKIVQNQLELPQNISSIASLPTSSDVLSASDNGSSAKISIAAHTIQYGRFARSYNSGSITGLNFSTRYYVYVDDPFYTGGGVTYYATTEIWQLSAGDDRRQVGAITTPADGGDTTIPDLPYCVDYDTVLPDGRFVRDLQLGDLVDCIDVRTGERGEFPLRAMSEGEEECYSLHTPEGAEIWQSKSTPMDLPDGSIAYTPDMLDKPAYVLCEGSPKISMISQLHRIGVRRVLKPDFGNRMFFAGRMPELTIATHNGVIKP
ncbi:hypothetical protein ACJJI3_01545 [Microbulbifer sp. ZKSA004]|uniref:hypothetical protein n=1 Tax=Microbulbifer sp. ZKSA004 TaxID=3243389 RepID=UPI00403A4FC9